MILVFFVEDKKNIWNLLNKCFFFFYCVSLKIIFKVVFIEMLFLLRKLKYEYNIFNGNFNKCVGDYIVIKLIERDVVCIVY